MPNRPRQKSSSTLTFSRDEWELLVTLPRRVLIAASTADPSSGERSVKEGLAGIEAIAAGRASGSHLVRDVVTAIYAESYHSGSPGSAEQLDSDVLQTLAACRYATEVLSRRCGAIDASGYRLWLHHIAAAVAHASHAAPAQVAGAVGLAESRFLYALDGILRP